LPGLAVRQLTLARTDGSWQSEVFRRSLGPSQEPTAGKQRRRRSRPGLAQPRVKDSVHRESVAENRTKRQTLCGVVEARQKSQLSQNLWVHPSYCLQTSELRDLLVTSDPQIRPPVHLNIHRSNTLLLHAKSSCCCLSSILSQLAVSQHRLRGCQGDKTRLSNRPATSDVYSEDSFRLLAISSYLIW